MDLKEQRAPFEQARTIYERAKLTFHGVEKRVRVNNAPWHRKLGCFQRCSFGDWYWLSYSLCIEYHSGRQEALMSRRKSPPRKVVRPHSARGISAVSLLTLLLIPFLLYAGPKPARASSQTEVRVVEVPSKAMDRDMRAVVMLPPSYMEDQKKHFPVLYLLHCAGGDLRMFIFSDELVRLVGEKDIIIVCPDGTPFGWYVDSPVLKNSKVETYLTSELISYIDREYRTVAKREGRALCGFSMGGHGSVTLAAKHPDLFISASSQGAIFDPVRWDGNWGMTDVFGPLKDYRSFWTGNSAMGLAERFTKDAADVTLLIECGVKDFALDENREFSRLLKKLGVEHTYRETAGGHYFTSYMDQLAGHIDFHLNALLSEDMAADSPPGQRQEQPHRVLLAPVVPEARYRRRSSRKAGTSHQHREALPVFFGGGIIHGSKHMYANIRHRLSSVRQSVASRRSSPFLNSKSP